jgi:hypothetical protein
MLLPLPLPLLPLPLPLTRRMSSLGRGRVKTGRRQTAPQD